MSLERPDTFGEPTDGAAADVQKRRAVAEASVRLGADKERLRIRASWLGRIIDSIPAAVMVVNDEGRIQETNAIAPVLLGYEDVPMKGMNIDMLLPEQYREKHARQRGHFRDHPEVRRMGEGRELPALHRSGRVFPAEVGLIPFEDLGRHYVLVMIVDVTCRRMRDVKLLAEARGKGAFSHLAGAVAHQINNPLAAMKFGLRALMKSPPGSDKARELETLIEDQIDRIEDAAHTLTDLARAHRPGLNAVTTDLNLVVSRILRLFASAFENGSIKLDARFTQEIGLVAIAEDDLIEVVMNLVENEREAIREHGLLIVTTRQRDKVVELLFEDDGPGLGEKPECVFEEYYTTKVDGTGIGLAVSRAICMKAGGTLMAENRPEGGARFIVTLPISQAHSIALS